MLHLNSRLCALVAMGLSLVTVPGLHAQNASVAASIVRGDVDGDGRVTRADADAVRAYLVRGVVPAGRSILPAGDANGDGRVTAADAALISRFAAGVDVSRFPVGRPVQGGEGGNGQRIDGLLVTTEYECTVEVESRREECRVMGPAAGVNGARLDLIFNTPLAFAVNTGGGSYVDGGATKTVINNVALKNTMLQPIGTTDWSTADPGGSKLVFTKGPWVSSTFGNPTPADSVWLGNPDGTATFADGDSTLDNKKYYTYVGVVKKDSISVSKPIQFVYTSNVRKYQYQYRISAPVRYEEGWLDITPDTVPVMAPGGTAALTKTEYNQFSVVQSNPVTWSTSNSAVATVSPSGQVTAHTDGTAMIKAVSDAFPVRADSVLIRVDVAPVVTGTDPADLAPDVSPGSDIVVTFSEPVNVTSASFLLECPTGSSQAFAVDGSGSSTITLTPNALLPAGAVCTVTVVAAQVSDADLNDGPNLMAGNHDFSFDVLLEASPDIFQLPVTGNVRINSADTSFTVTKNDSISPSVVISFAGWNGIKGVTQQGGNVVMVDSGDARGQFTYDPPAGYEGPDSFEYTIKGGSKMSTSTVALQVSGMVWFVNNNATTPCTKRADGCGRLSTPYSTLAAFQAENNGTGNNPAAGDNVFLFQSASTYDSPVTLLAQQKLIGQDAGSSLSAITGITPSKGSLPFPEMNTGAPAATINGAVQLANVGSGSTVNNTVRGLTIAPTAAGAVALSGSSFGTLTTAELIINYPLGQALSLTTGTLSGGFDGLTSGGGTHNVFLSSVKTIDPAILGVAGNSLAGATSDAFRITGGDGSFTYPGTINNTAALAVNVNGKTGGTVSFPGAINPGGAVPAGGVSLTSNAGATITFTGGVRIATTTTVPFTATGGGTVEVTGASNTISLTAAPGTVRRAVNLNGITLGANGMTFASIQSTSTDSTAFSATNVGGSSFTAGSLSVTGTNNAGSRGLDLTTNSAPFTFTTASVSGTAAEGIYLSGNTAAVAVNGGSVGTTAGDALFVNGGNAAVTVAANLTKNTAGRIANIANRTGGTTTISGTLSCTGTCTGIQGNANAGIIDFTAATKTLTTAANAAVTLTGNTGTINFTNGGLVINTTSGAGFSATGGGTVNITTGGTNNTINSTAGGTAVNISGTTIGGSGVTFYRVDATGGGSNGIVLANTGAGAFQVTGDGASDAANTTRGRTTAKSGGGTVALGSGGTISGKSSDGVSLSTTGAVTLRNMVIQNNSGDGVQATNSSGVTIDNTRITGHTDNSSLFFTTVSAPVILHSEMENNAFGGGAPGADIHNVRLISNTGAGSVQNSVIANTSAGAERQLQIFSTSGTLNIAVTNNRIAGSTVGDGVGVYAFGSSNITANFQNDSIHDNSAFGLDSGTETTQSSSLNITVNNSKFRNNFVGVTVAHGSSGTNTFNVTNNNFQNHGSVSVNINRLGAVSFTSFGLFSGTVSGNTIGTAGVANSGSPLGSNAIDVKTNGNGGTTQVSILNNIIREIGNDAIRVIGRDANVGHTLHARVQSNNIANFHASALTGIRGELGAAAGDKITMCLNISGNTVVNAPQNGVRVRSVAGGSPPPQITLTMPSYDGTGATYLANQNPAATGLTANTSFANGNAGSTTTAGNCTTP
jgi:hypothetical protein